MEGSGSLVRDGSGQVAPVLAVGLDHLVGTDDLVGALTAHYRTFPAQERAPARAEVTVEAERLDELTQTIHRATTAVRTAVDDVEVAVVGADTALDAYAATAEAARSSHVANTPPPPRARSGGGGGGTRLCYRYSAWGGTRLMPC